MAHSHSHSSSSHGHGGPGSDDMNLKKIVVIGVIALSVFAAGIIWAYVLLRAQMKELDDSGRAPPASEIGKPEIGIVDQVLFSTDTRLATWKASHAKHLGSYGWVDRAKGIARMPIEAAMQKVIASPPDIAGEGIAPAAAPPTIPPPAPVDTTETTRVTPRKGTHIGTKVDDESHKSGAKSGGTK